MEENNKVNNENLNFGGRIDSIKRKKSSKKYLSQILLNTKKYLSNNKYFIRNTNDSENMTNLQSSKTSNNKIFPPIQSLKQTSSINNIKLTRNYMGNSPNEKNFKKNDI